MVREAAGSGSMAEQDFWFARNSRGLPWPVSRKAIAVLYVFGFNVAFGGLAFFLMAMSGQSMLGAILFVVAIGFGINMSWGAISRMTDRDHSLEDYRAGRVPPRATELG
jgi:hypothetical protein